MLDLRVPGRLTAFVQLAALAEDCPQCGALKREPCVTSTDKPRGKVHVARSDRAHARGRLKSVWSHR